MATLFDVEIELDPTREVMLRAGYSANAEVVVREKHDVVLIPERLVLFEDGGAATFVERPGEGPEAPPEKVAVVTGLSDGLTIEIVDGLAARLDAAWRLESFAALAERGVGSAANLTVDQIESLVDELIAGQQEWLGEYLP